MAAVDCYNSDPIFGVSKWQQGAILGSSGSPNYNTTPDRMLTGTDYDFYNEHSTIVGFDIQYITPTNPGIYTINYYSNSIYPVIDPQSSATTPHCESRLPCVGPLCPVVMGPMPIINAFPQLGLIKSQLTALVNAGDHDYLYDLVLNVSQSDLNDVYDALINSNPSHDILVLACANDIFSPSMIRNILVENSYGIKSLSVRDALDSREEQLSDSMMDEIILASENISTYEDLMFQVDYVYQEYTYLMNESLYALKSRDSIPMDSIVIYLESINDFLSTVKLIYISFEENNLNEAQEHYTNLQSISDDDEELQDYSDLYNNILVDIYTNHEGDFSQMTSAQISILYSIVNNCTYAAGIAKYLLGKYTDYVFSPSNCTITPPNPKRKEKIEIQSSNTNISIYPNPAKDILNIEIPDCEDCQAEVIISDISSRIIKSHKLSQSKNQISLSMLSSGTYFVKVILKDKISISKIIINK